MSPSVTRDFAPDLSSSAAGVAAVLGEAGDDDAVLALCFASRGHALALIHQLLSITHADQSLIEERRLPSDGLDLPPEPFLEKAPEPLKPHAVLPVALDRYWASSDPA